MGEWSEAIGTFSAAVAAIAALVSVVSVASESRAQRKRDRFVRWFEDPARAALDRFHLAAIEPIQKSLQRNPDASTYQWQAQQVQSAKRDLQRILSQSALTLGDGRLETRLTIACNELEDEIFKQLQAYAIGDIVDLDVDEVVRRCTTRVASIILRGDPTWEE